MSEQKPGSGRKPKEFPEFSSVNNFLLALPSHRASVQTDSSGLVLAPVKFVVAAARAYINENPHAQAGVEITDLIINDLRRYGFRVDIYGLAKGVTPLFRKIRQTSGWGGDRKTKRPDTRRTTAGFKDKRPPPVISDPQFHALRRRFKEFMGKRVKKGKLAEAPHWQNKPKKPR